MQSSLAVLQFPLAAVSASMPDAGLSSEDFTASFLEELPATGREIVPVDPAPTGTDQSALWIAPILSVASVIPAGLQDIASADLSNGEPTIPADAAAQPAVVPLSAPTEAQALIAGPDPATVFVAAPSEAIAILPDGPKGRIASGSADPVVAVPGVASMERAFKPASRPGTELQEGRPRDETSVEVPVPRVRERAEAVPAPEVAVVPAPPKALAATNAPEQGAGLPAAVAAGPVSMVDQPGETAPAMPEPVRGQGQAPLSSSKISELLPLLAEETDPPVLPVQGEVEGLLSQEPDAPHPVARSTPEAVVESLAAVAITVPDIPSAPEIPVFASFWERYFTDRSDAPYAAVRPADRPSPEFTDRVAGAIGIMPWPARPEERPADAMRSPVDVFSVSEAGPGVDITVRKASSPNGSASPLPIASLPEARPTLQMMSWVEGPADRVDGFESALSLVPVASSGSVTAGAPGPGAPQSLPVQQVAAQLAGVLVLASDRATELALAPEELGKVRLRLEPDAANPDRLTILINVERPETLDLFRRHAGELAEAIRAAGYSGADIDFGRQGQGSGGDQQPAGSGAASDLPPDETAPTRYAPRTIAGATLDLRL